MGIGDRHSTRQTFLTDVSKTGGLTEGLRIAALASAWKLRINPHTSATGLNVAASIHFLASIDNAGYFEADLARHNPFRDELCDWQAEVAPDGTVRPPNRPGLGVEIDENVLASLPLIDGPGYV